MTEENEEDIVRHLLGDEQYKKGLVGIDICNLLMQMLNETVTVEVRKPEDVPDKEEIKYDKLGRIKNLG